MATCPFFGCEIFGADPEDLEIAEGNSVAVH